MIPTLLLIGLVMGRWWWMIPVAAAFWTVLLLLLPSGELTFTFVGGAFALGALNMAVGVAVHQALWRGGRLIWRRLRRRPPAPEADAPTPPAPS